MAKPVNPSDPSGTPLAVRPRLGLSRAGNPSPSPAQSRLLLERSRAALDRIEMDRLIALRCVHCGVEKFEWPQFFTNEEYERLRCPSGRGHFYTSDPRVVAVLEDGECARG